MPALLFLHDDLDVADYAGIRLEQAIPGLRVCRANSCDGAQRECVGDCFDLVVADLPLSDTECLRLVGCLRRRSPRARAVLAGASMPAARALEGCMGNDIILLSELYDLESLVQAVRQALLEPADCVIASGGLRAARVGGRAVRLDRHRARNVLAGLVAGLYAFAEELRASAGEPEAVRAAIEEHVDSLVSEVERLAELLEDEP